MAPKPNAALETMIEEATVDAYNEDEQLTGLFTMIEEHLVVPFATTVLGVEVTVKKVDLIGDSIVAICARGRDRQRIDVLDLPLPTPTTGRLSVDRRLPAQIFHDLGRLGC